MGESKTHPSKWAALFEFLVRLPTLLVAVVALGLACMLCFAILLGFQLFKQFSKPNPPTFTSQGPTVTQLQEMRQLVVSKVHVTDILTAEDASYRGSWLIKGDALVAVNTDQVRVIDKDDVAKRATIVLAPPSVMQPRVDHERTKTWDVNKTSWVPWKGDQGLLRDNAMFHAQQLVERAANSEEVRSQARDSATLLLKKMYGLFDWEIEVRWLDQSVLPPSTSR